MKTVSCAVLVLSAVDAFNGPGKQTDSKPEVSTGAEAGASKAVMHDFASKEDCWNGMASKSSDCWTGSDGVNYRYACKEGEAGKIYTDICESASCDPASCLGEWTFHEEVEKTCYSDGSTFYQFQCTDLGLDEEYDAKAMDSTRISGSSSATCQSLGWDASGGKSPFVCASSKIGGECHDDKTWAEAEAACASIGARLCSSEELSNDEGKGAGCKGDIKATWTADECDAGHVHQAGAAKGLSSAPVTCADDSTKGHVRCCADAVNTVVGASSGLPAGYRLATAFDFDASDAVCGGVPKSEYSCWTNPATGLSQRFACSPDSEYVWSQNCGTDDSCGGSSCSGEWFNSDELLDRCYQDPSGGLYSYTC